jgi:hypothetical protein
MVVQVRLDTIRCGWRLNPVEESRAKRFSFNMALHRLAGANGITRAQQAKQFEMFLVDIRARHEEQG